MPNRTTPLTPARPATPGRRPSRTGLLGGPAPILISAVLWGTSGTAGSLAPTGAPAAAIGCAGPTVGGILLFLTSRGAASLPAACTRAERWLLVLGAPAVAGYPVAFYPAVARTGVAVATVIALGSAPVFAGLLSWITGVARPTARWTSATAAAVLGCTLLVPGREITGRAAPTDLTGVVLAVCAGLSYAAYSLICGRLISRGHPSDAVMGVLFGTAGVLVLPLLLSVDIRWSPPAAVRRWRCISPCSRSSWPTGSSGTGCATPRRRWPRRSPLQSPQLRRSWASPSSANACRPSPGADLPSLVRGWSC
nr:DMT family transporter [Streptomyces guryensis]